MHCTKSLKLKKKYVISSSVWTVVGGFIVLISCQRLSKDILFAIE
jgi:hypothetical protein